MNLPQELPLQWPPPVSDDAYRRSLDDLAYGVYVTDRKRCIVFWNRAAEILTGFSAEDVVGRCCADNILVHVNDAGCPMCTSECPLSRTMHDGQPRQADVFLRHKLGHRVPVLTLAFPMADEQGEIGGALELFTDNDRQKQAQEQAAELASQQLIDPVSPVGNRRFLEQKLSQHIAGRRNPFGVLLIDIDALRAVNDQHGREAGDAVLAGIAKTLVGGLRPSDVLGRWDDDTFLAVLPGITERYLPELAEKCRALVSNSAVLAGESRIEVTVSIGATRLTQHDSVPSLLRRAQELLANSKQAGGNCVSA